MRRRDIKVVIREKKVPAGELLKDLQRVGRKMRTRFMSQRDYEKCGKYSIKSFHAKFQSWVNACERAGLRSAKFRHTTDIELFENLIRVWKKLGRQPASRELKKPVSDYSLKLYNATFGSWNKTLGLFCVYLKDPEYYKRTIVKVPKWSKLRKTMSVSIKYGIMQRDNFRCQACGRSPATHPGLALHIDHIKPLSKGGRTILGNLQTLCMDCNLGKGDRVERSKGRKVERLEG